MRGASLARILRRTNLALPHEVCLAGRTSPNSPTGRNICRNPVGQLGSGGSRAYIVTGELGGSGNGNVVSMKLQFTESAVPKEPKVWRVKAT